MTYIHFIGIDVSQEWLDVAMHGQAGKPLRFSNDHQGFTAFSVQYAEALPQALVVLEATGGYEAALIAHLLESQMAVHRADPLTAKHFLRSLRLRGKTDQLDAIALARYGHDRAAELTCLQPTSAEQRELANLAARRGDLIALQVMEQQRLQHPRYKDMADLVKPILEAIAGQLQIIETRLIQLIDTSSDLKQRFDIMTSVKGVGKTTAIILLAAMPELGKLTRRQAASLAGCAPHPKDSGKKQHYRATSGGRQQIKRALFMAAMSARQHNPTLRAFYENLTQNGKKPIVAITAIMRKIITILNAIIRDKHYAKSW